MAYRDGGLGFAERVKWAFTPPRSFDSRFDIPSYRRVPCEWWYRCGGWFFLEAYWLLYGWMGMWDYRFRMRYRDRWLKPSRIAHTDFPDCPVGNGSSKAEPGSHA